MRSTMKRLRSPSAIGVMTLLAFGVALYVGWNAERGLPGEDHAYVQVAFDELNNLRTSNEVRQNGVRIGQVYEVDYADGAALVTLQLDPDRTVHRDAFASIGNRSGLGQKFVEMDMGTTEAGELGDGVLPVDQTFVPVEIDEVLGALDDETRQALSTSLNELGGGVGGRGQDLNDVFAAAPGLLRDLGVVSGSVASEEADLPALLDNARQLATRFDGRTDDLASLIDDTADVFAALDVDQGAALAATVEQAPEALDTARPVLDEVETVAGDLRVALEELREGRTALVASVPDLRGFLREGIEPLDRVPGVASTTAPALADLTPVVEDTQPLTPRVDRALDDASVLLADFAPYASDFLDYFTNTGRALSTGDSKGNYLRVGVVLNALSTGVPLIADLIPDDTLTCYDPYPEPGEAMTRTRGALGEC